METVPAAPFRTVMSPERVSTSRSTGPLTWNERSKVPMTEAKPARELVRTNTSVRMARWRIQEALIIVGYPVNPVCHPERSEGPLLLAHIFGRVGVLRFAQDDSIAFQRTAIVPGT